MIESFFNVDHIRIFLALTMLSVACVLDIRKREIHDSLWIIFGCISVTLVFFEPDLAIYSKSVAISVIIAPIVLLAWRIGFFGGADALCLIILAVLAPQVTLSQNSITPLTTLSNGLIISTFSIVLNLGRNLISIIRHQDLFLGFQENILRKTLAILIGYKTTAPSMSFIIEKNEKGQKKFDFTFKNIDCEPFCYNTNVWVTPAIPYLVYLLFGFVIQITIGDIILNIFKII